MKSNNLYSRNRDLAGMSVAVATGLAGVAVLPRYVTDMDGGEFALIAARGGIAHPPGYPLYSILLRTWHEVFARWFTTPPDVTSPPVLALLSVALSMVTAWVLWRATLTWLDRPAPYSSMTPWLAATAVMAVMLATPVWRASTGLEPFALNNLMAACLVLIAAKILTTPGTMLVLSIERLATATGLIFGLAFCNHHTLAFAVPMALPLLSWTQRGKSIEVVRGLAKGFAAGLLPIGWLALQRGNPDGLVWGDWSDFPARLVNHLFRRDYGTLSLMTTKDGTWLSGPAFVLESSTSSLTWIWVAPAAAGAIRAFSRPRRGPSEWMTLERISLATFATTGVAMATLFRVQATPETSAIMERFVALPLLFLCVPIASGLAWASARMPAKGGRSLAVLALAGLTLHASSQLDTSNRRLETSAGTHLEASSEAIRLLGDAIPVRRTWIVTNGDLDFFGFAYKTAGASPRPVMIQSGLWTSVWYRRKILGDMAVTGTPATPEKVQALRERLPAARAFGLLVEILLTAAEDGEVVLLSTGTFPGMERLLGESYPLASFIRVIPAGTANRAVTAPDHRPLVATNARLIDPLLAELAVNPCRSAWECHALQGWRRTWKALEATSSSTGDAESLKICTDILAKLGQIP